MVPLKKVLTFYFQGGTGEVSLSSEIIFDAGCASDEDPTLSLKRGHPSNGGTGPISYSTPASPFDEMQESMAKALLMVFKEP